MRTVKVYRHGVTMGTAPRVNPSTPEKRGECKGWTASATRRNLAFLRSIPENSLTGHGEAITLTLRECPKTYADWSAIRTAFVKRLFRAGAIRIHWVTEWQRRGVPHLHACVWWGVPPSEYRGAVIHHWIELAGVYGVSPKAQTCKPITDALGWFQYCAKHAARGVKHYQRDSANIPEGWHKTGRMWGYRGEWTIDEPTRLILCDETFYRARRLARNWRIADARASGDGFRISTARGMLRCHKPTLSNVRGVSEWIPEDIFLCMLLAAAGSTGSVDYRCDAESSTESLQVEH
jgi:hypothetical protein